MLTGLIVVAAPPEEEAEADASAAAAALAPAPEPLPVVADAKAEASASAFTTVWRSLRPAKDEIKNKAFMRNLKKLCRTTTGGHSSWRCKSRR